MKFLRSFQKSLPLFIFGFLLHLLFKPAFSHAADWDEIIAYLQDASTLILEINSNVDGTYNFLPSPSVNKSFASNENGALRILSVQNNNAGFLFNSDIYIYFKDIAFSGFTNAVSMKNNGVISFEGFSQFEANALGLSLDNSSANFINSTVTFNSNTGANGGAINAVNSSFLNFIYSSATFSNNTASQNGGAVYLEKSTLAFSYSNANFFKNSANVNGGAISIFQSTLSILNSNLAFSTNSAAALGGAFYSQNSISLMQESNITFASNTALSGGAMALKAAANMFVRIVTLNFLNNTAIENGGAVYLINARNNLAPEYNNGSNALIQNNTAGKNGGAIFAESSFYGIGAQTGHFFYNTAQSSGGAIFAFNSEISHLGMYGNYNYNTAVSGGGGAIFVQNSTYSFRNDNQYQWGDHYFNYNKAINGGAIYADRSNLTLVRGQFRTYFQFNTAQENGGAIYAVDSYINLSAGWQSYFTNNTAGQNGGAVYLERSTMTSSPGIDGIHTHFENNIANGALNDVYFADARSAIISSKFSSGIRTDGDINAVLIFGSGDFSKGTVTDIKNTVIALNGASNFNSSSVSISILHIANNGAVTFNANSIYVNLGTATVNGANSYINFQNRITTVTALTVSNNAKLTLINGSINPFYVTDLTLNNATIELDLGKSGVNDLIYVTNKLDLTNIKITLGDAGASEISEFLHSVNIPLPADIYKQITPTQPINFSITQLGNSLYVNTIGLSWNTFAWQFQNAPDGEIIHLVENTFARLETLTLRLSTPTSNIFFTVDGDNFVLDAALNSSNAKRDFVGMYIPNTNVTFMDIGFLHFGNGNLMKIMASTITFNGDIYFNENGNNGGGDGNIIFWAQYSSISFINSISSFSKNSLGDAGIMRMQNYSNLYFINSTAAFFNNTTNNAEILRVQDNSTLYITNSMFAIYNNVINNYGILRIVNNNSKLYAQNSIIVFSNNANKNGAGGGLRVESAIAHFLNSTITFSNNHATYEGGAIYTNNITSFVYSSVTFFNNTSSATGGAINVAGGSLFFDHSVIDFTSNVVFSKINNTNYQRGGAIYNNPNAYSYVYFYFSTVNFTSNTASREGGALYGRKFVFQESLVNFDSNISSMGAAMYLLNDRSLFLGSSITFTNNGALFHGAAIFLNNSGLSLSSGSVVTFLSNVAGSSGGAIYLQEDSSNLLFSDSHINFFSNSANAGGAIFSRHRNFNFLRADIDFAQNIAQSSGGAIYLDGINSITNFSTSTILFNKNSASIGGAVFSSSAQWNINYSSLLFISNSAELGGAIFANNLTRWNITFSTLNFLLNAAQNGGAVFLSNSTATFRNSQIFFTSNTAVSDDGRGSGGAINVFYSSIAFINSNLFLSHNFAQNGGSIYASYGKITFNNSRIEISENSSDVGAAISLNYSTLFITNNSTLNFSNNYSAQNLADIYVGEGSTIIFSGNNFVEAPLYTSAFDAAGKIIKRDAGILTFAGESPYLANVFEVVGGTALFQSAVSSIAFVNISSKTLLSFKDGSAESILYIFGTDFIDANFYISSSSVEMDINFFTGAADLIDIANNFTAINSTVNVNLVYFGRGAAKIITARDIAPDILSNFHASNVYALTIPASDPNSIYIEITGQWNLFVADYKIANAGGPESFSLASNANAGYYDFPFAIGAPLGSNLIIDGQNNILDSAKRLNLGFLLTEKTINFSNIGFANFRAQWSGGVINSTDSMLKFSGGVSFSSNLSMLNGGAIFSSNTKISFANSIVSFTTNAANISGGAIFAFASNISFSAAEISFTSNIANISGGAFYLDQTTISFMNSNLSFLANRSKTQSGDTVYATYSTLTFLGQGERENILSISYSSSSQHSGLAIRNSFLTIKNMTLNILKNIGRNAGSINAETNSSVLLEDISLNVTGNFSGNGSAFLLNNNSNLTAINFDAIFSSNTVFTANSAPFYIEASTAYFKGSNQIIFSSNVSRLAGGGAMRIDKASVVFENINNLSFANNASAVTNSAGAIFITANSILTFKNSTINFVNNSQLSNSNDIYFADAASKIIFDGDNFLSNGIRTAGLAAADISKTGQGALIFEGAPANISNTFSIAAGSVNFRSSSNTLNVLHMANNTTLSLQNNSAQISVSSLYVKGDMTLTNAYLALDVDFVKGESDFLQIFGSFTVSNSTLQINDFALGIEQVKIITAQSMPSDILNSLFAPAGFAIQKVGNNDLYLTVSGAWNTFAAAFSQTAQGAALPLEHDTSSLDSSFPFPLGSPQNTDFIVDGQNNTLDAAGISGLGFAPINRTFTLKDITLANFIDFAISASVSTVIFTGAINFTRDISPAVSYGAAISLSYSTAIFENSQILFANNSTQSNIIDIHFDDPQSAVVFSGDNVLLNGLRSNGDLTAQIIKQGEGTLSFEQSPSIIENTFNVFEGAIEFKSNISTISVLNIYDGSTISFANGSASNELYILGDFHLSGFWILEADFTKKSADRIWIGGKFYVNDSTISVTILDGENEIITILSAKEEIDKSDLASLYIEQKDFSFMINETLWGWDLMLGRGRNWNEFVVSYTIATGALPLKLLPNTSASLEVNPLALGLNPVNVLVFDGQGNVLDASGDFYNLGFIFENSSMTFMNISFTNFTSDNSSGAVMSIENSTIQFLSNASFRNNIVYGENDISGGTIFAQNSWLNSYGANFEFIGNSAKSLGGAIYLQNSTLTFTNSKINFKNNLANDISNDIYLSDEESSIIFIGNNILTNGIRSNGNAQAQIIKIGAGDLIFAGDNSIIENIFNVEAGNLIFQSAVSTFSVLTMQNNSTLSLENKTADSKLFISSLSLNANLILEIDFIKVKSDKIYTSSITIFTGNDLIIKKLSVREIDAQEMPIIFADDFFGFNQNGTFTINVKDIFNYDQSLYTLRFDAAGKTLYIKNIAPSDLHAAQTDNQQSIENIVNREGVLKYPLLKMTNAQKRFAYDSLSGSFLTNIFTGLLYENNETLFNQIGQTPAYKPWANINYLDLGFNKSKQTLGGFRSQKIELTVGGDLFAHYFLRAGIFGGASVVKFSQSNNSADLFQSNVGIFLDTSFSPIKAQILFGAKYAQGSAKREIKLDTTYNPQSRILLSGLNAALKLEYALFEIRTQKLQQNAGPFILYEFNQIDLNYIKETDGGITNLYFAPQTLQNHTAKGGIEFRRASGAVSFFANIFGGQNLSARQEMQASFIELDQDFKVESDDENLFFYGGGAGANLVVSKSMTFGMQAGITLNANFKNYNTSLNAVYNLPKTIHGVRPEIPKLDFEENSSKLTPQSARELAIFAQLLSRARPKLKKITIFTRLNNSQDDLSVQANRLMIERSKNVMRLLNKNKISKRKISFAARKLITKNRMQVRVER